MAKAQRYLITAVLFLPLVGCERKAPPADPNTSIVKRTEPREVEHSATGMEAWRSILECVPFNKSLSNVQAITVTGAATPTFKDEETEVGSATGEVGLGGIESPADLIRRGPVLLVLMGGLAVLAGIVLIVWAKRFALGVAVAVGGGVLVAAGILFESYPWIVLVVAFLALGVGIWWLLDARAAKRAKVALTAVVAGVEDAGTPEVKAAVKKAAGSAAAQVKATITAVKTKLGV